MLTLVIDTCSPYYQILLANNDNIVSHYQAETANQQAEELVLKISASIKDKNFTFQDIKRIIVTIGPGSFTGIKIGLAAALALAYATQAIIITVTTLEVLGYATTGVVKLSAGRGRSYCQKFMEGTAISEMWLENSVEDLYPERKLNMIHALQIAQNKSATSIIDIKPIYNVDFIHPHTS